MTILDMLIAILPLILVLGLLYAALIFVRKSGFQFGKNGNNISQIRVISTQAIMNRKFVSIVKVQNSYLVLGVSENSINLLKELDNIDDDVVVDNTTEQQSFSTVFKQSLGMKKEK
jgi:flagellar biosynthetic protein FliO